MSTAVDAAIVAALQADALLQGLLPGGVHPDLAPELQQETPYIIVALEPTEDVDEHGGPAFEDATYVVMVVDKATDAANANAAYERAHSVLVGQPLIVPGETVMSIVRRGRHRFAERDGSVLWRFVLGRYRVMTDPT